ncbi:MAG: YARHG domain-containing protein [Coriobacteriales bacterium]|nr:YARHG domain-containing protein [Coriobacteriales bacterium]
MFCENCGAQITNGQQFCSRCGTPVTGAGSGLTGATGTTPVPTSQPHRETSSVVLPVLAALCAVLVMVLVAFGLMAGGVVNVGGGQAPAVSQAAQPVPTTQTTTAQEEIEEAKKAKEEAEAAKREAEKAKEEAEQKAKEQSSESAITNNITINSAPGTTRVTTSAPSSSSSAGSSAYVLPDSTTHYYSTSELSSLSDWDLYIARNEIYARHGRGFVRQDLRNYFSNCSWYTERYDPDYFDDVIAPNMSDCEWHNIQTILDYEHYRGSPYP